MMFVKTCGLLAGLMSATKFRSSSRMPLSSKPSTPSRSTSLRAVQSASSVLKLESARRTVAMLSANEAWAYGILGDARRAMTALARAEEEYVRGSGPAAPWVRFFGPTEAR